MNNTMVGNDMLNGSVSEPFQTKMPPRLCERYRDVRMKRKTLFAWKSRLERLSMVPR